jgi:hypothetical protein
MTCKKAQGFLGVMSVAVTSFEEAAKFKYGPEKALELVADADRLVAIKGKRIVLFDLKNDRPDDATLLAHLIGPTGNLRAPTARIGRTLVVGFNEDGYKQALGL